MHHHNKQRSPYTHPPPIAPSGLIQWTVRQSAEMENLMTSTERIHEYSTLPYEAPVEGEPGASIAPPDWPSYGAIEYQNVTASYRPGLPPAIRNLSFALQGGASCGVVGRTGSGKSSLMLTLFRLIPINEGRVLIDNVDTAALGTDRLRSALAIIPQVRAWGGGVLWNGVRWGGVLSCHT